MTSITKNKFIKYLFVSLFMALVTSQVQTAQAQELSTGADVVSTYVWRGVAYSNSPALQPWVEFSADGFAIGAWGSQNYDGGQEMDLYAGYGFDIDGAGLYLGLTDYYYPGSPWLDGESHAFEINAGLDIEELSISGNYIINEAAFAGSAGSDLYFEVSYNPGTASLFIGGGDGWHSSDGDFAIVNIGVGTSSEIELTETFALPVFGSVILNPDSEQFYIVFGFSL